MMVEFAKLKHTKIVWLSLLMTVGIVLFANMSLFAGDNAAAFQANPDTAWAGHLIGIAMALAFLTPLQLALVASRIVDTEHVNGGWRLNAIAGTRPGALLLRKFGVATVVVVVAKCIEFAGAVALPVAMGAPAPRGAMLETWLRFGLGVTGTTLALLAVMLLLAALVESQLVVLAVGVVGGFFGIASLLSPPWLAAVNPFGYIAVILPFGFTEAGVTPSQPGWLLWSGYLVLAVAVLVAGTKALDRKEI